MRQPTIWEALEAKLGRAPTNEECRIEIHRILGEVRSDIKPRRLARVIRRKV